MATEAHGNTRKNKFNNVSSKKIFPCSSVDSVAILLFTSFFSLLTAHSSHVLAANIR